MLRTELDRLLEYLATGDDERQVLDALQQQPDAGELLARARVALELLSPAGLSLSVLHRLHSATISLSGAPAPEPGLWLGTALSAPGPLAGKARLERSRGSLRAQPATEIGESRIDDIVSAGAREFVPLGALLLDRDAPQPIRAFEPGLGGMLAAKMAVSDSPRRYAADALPLRVNIPGGGTLGLRHEAREGADYLVLQITGDRSGSGPLQVTWLPDEGEVLQAFTDGSGTVSLPWPGLGSGTLRIDAARTLELQILAGL